MIRLGARIRRSPRVGLGIAPHRVCAIARGHGCSEAGEGEVWSCPLDAPDETSGEWPGLRQALAEFANDFEAESARVEIALLPPLVCARMIELPRLREHELRRVLKRNAGRYFLGAEGPQVVAAVRARGRKRSAAPVFAAAAPAAIIDAVFDAVEDVGWSVGSLVPAHAAWAAVPTATSSERTDTAWVAVLGADRTEAVRAERGRVAGVRRLPASASDRTGAALADVVGGEESSDSSPVTLVGPGPLRRAASDALRAADRTPAESDALSGLVGSPAALAAVFAGRAHGPELLPEPRHAERMRASRRTTAALAAAAVAFIVLAAGLELWGARRELAGVESHRRALRPTVAEVLETRGVLQALDRRLAALSALERSRPRWSVVLAGVTEHLPHDAHLVAFRAGADTLVLEGVAEDAAGVFESIRAARTFTNVRARAPIQRERGDGGEPVERFTLAARVQRDSMATAGLVRDTAQAPARDSAVAEPDPSGDGESRP